MKNLERPIKITVCADGFVSIMRGAQERRLRAGLVCYSADNVPFAMALINQVCNLKPCFHGGKTGMTVEPQAPNWNKYPAHEIDSHVIEAISELNEIFAKADVRGKKP